jgi:L-ribulose-5-phosphate 4-epimerase
MTAQTLTSLREQIVQAARFLAETGVLSHSGHGNMSVRVHDTSDQMLLTSVSRISRLATEQIALVDFSGRVLEGAMDPTSAEIVAMHAVVYEHKPDVQAVIHTHSPRASTFALAHEPLPCRYEALLRFGVAEAIPVAPWGPRGSDESVRHIADTIQAHPTVMAVLLANHGLLVFGRDVMASATLVTAMEEAAEMELDAPPIGGAKPFPEGALEAVRERLRQFHR